MKAMKCIFAVIVGVLAGLWSACDCHKQTKTGAPGGSSSTTEGAGATRNATSQTRPVKERDLPIRRPILE